jgi:hypothetical protein
MVSARAGRLPWHGNRGLKGAAGCAGRVVLSAHRAGSRPWTQLPRCPAQREDHSVIFDALRLMPWPIDGPKGSQRTAGACRAEVAEALASRPTTSLVFM